MPAPAARPYNKGITSVSNSQISQHLGEDRQIFFAALHYSGNLFKWHPPSSDSSQLFTVVLQVMSLIRLPAGTGSPA